MSILTYLSKIHLRHADTERRYYMSKVQQARSEQLKRRKEIYELKYHQTKQGAKGGWHNSKSIDLENDKLSFSSESKVNTQTFAEDTAEKTTVHFCHRRIQ